MRVVRTADGVFIVMETPKDKEIRDIIRNELLEAIQGGVSGDSKEAQSIIKDCLGDEGATTLPIFVDKTSKLI